MSFLSRRKWAEPQLPATVTPSPPTILLFGTTGVGKSTIVNMLPDDPAHPKETAEAQSSAQGVTSTMKAYRKLVGGQVLEVLDSMGTGEGKHGTVPTHKAIEGMYDHVLGLKDGLHLVVLVMKGGRITVMDENNYVLLRLLFGDDVPIVLAITGMENEDDKDAWWDNQKKGRISVSKSVGIIGIMGRKGAFREDYEQSAKDLQQLIRAESLPAGGGFVLKQKAWFRKLINTVSNLADANLKNLKAFQNQLLELLLSYDIGKYDASVLAGKIRVAERLPVVVFVGRSGVGKSTIIDFFTDKTQGEAKAAGGQTRDVRGFAKVINDRQIRIIDTPGVGNPATGTVIPPDQAIERLRDALVAEDSNINAIVLIVRGQADALAVADVNHYSLIRKFCGPNIPIYLIVTASPPTNPPIATVPATRCSFRGQASIVLNSNLQTSPHANHLERLIVNAVEDGEKHDVPPFELKPLLGEVKTLANDFSGEEFDKGLFRYLNPSQADLVSAPSKRQPLLDLNNPNSSDQPASQLNNGNREPANNNHAPQQNFVPTNASPQYASYQPAPQANNVTQAPGPANGNYGSQQNIVPPNASGQYGYYQPASGSQVNNGNPGFGYNNNATQQSSIPANSSTQYDSYQPTSQVNNRNTGFGYNNNATQQHFVPPNTSPQHPSYQHAAYPTQSAYQYTTYNVVYPQYPS